MEVDVSVFNREGIEIFEFESVAREVVSRFAEVGVWPVGGGFFVSIRLLIDFGKTVEVHLE